MIGILPILNITENSPVNDVSAEVYKDYDGRLITEDQMIQRYNYCIKMINDGKLNSSTDCSTYIFTKDGITNIYNEALNQAYLEEGKRILGMDDETYNKYFAPENDKDK